MEVALFLIEFKKRIRNQQLDIVLTQKNRSTKYALGLRVDDIEEMLLNLELIDLFKGPLQDRDARNELVYVFKKNLNNHVIYIKKKLGNDGKARCLSFHFDEN